MLLSEFIAEIKTSMKSYDAANLIDDISIHNWVIDELKRFGSNIMNLQPAVIPIKNSQGRLPDNYWHLRLAVKVEPHYFECEDESDDIRYSPELYERIERSATWNTAGECESISEKTISERVFIKDKRVDLYYHCPTPLNITKGVVQKKGEMQCLNLTNRYKNQCENNIIIQGRTIQTNFNEGNIYIQYYGLLSDEDGEIIIPETQHNRLKTYLEYHVKSKILEDLIINNDDPNVVNKLQYFVQQAQNQFSLALTETKFESLNWKSTKKLLKQQAKKKMYKFEAMFPSN